MLLLTMNIGSERYALDVQHVVEVIPLVKLEHVPRVDPCIRGVFNYRGTPVPVIDLCVFFDNRDCRKSLGSRIIITRISTPDDSAKTIGLLAEHMTEVIRCDPRDFRSSGIQSDKAPFLKHILQRENELLQIIDISSVIPESVSRQLTAHEAS